MAYLKEGQEGNLLLLNERSSTEPVVGFPKEQQTERSTDDKQPEHGDDMGKGA